jgi:hypothetical protein
VLGGVKGGANWLTVGVLFIQYLVLVECAAYVGGEDRTWGRGVVGAVEQRGTRCAFSLFVLLAR